MTDKTILLGNEAVARGAWEAGARVVSSYPGTPSTEITEALSSYEDVYCEWAPNEKVALEVAVGASIAGARAMACMKHVGLNVAADPLFTAAYTGVGGGLVVVVADDPGMHSSQNEQDSRYYARSAHVPMLEPADAQEGKDFVARAFEISEAYDTPVFLRLTTRIAHSRGLVETADRAPVELKPYERDVAKYVMMPGMAKLRHVKVEERESRLTQDLFNAPIGKALNRIEMRDASLGVVCSGAVYQYVREALPHASVFKLGMVYPLPIDALRAFADDVDTLVVIEELEPFIEDALNAAGIACFGKLYTGVQGELSPQAIRTWFGGTFPLDVPTASAAPENRVAVAVTRRHAKEPDLPQRPPVLCPGCPHRGAFTVIAKLKLKSFGDIGCYSLGAMPPQTALDAVLCMGASLGMAHGALKARPEWAGETISVIGDSTFVHSGITGLVNAVYNRSGTVLVLLDNSTTGMTGHQNHPATGKDLRGGPAPQLNLRALCETIGARVSVVDPLDMPAFEAALKAALAAAKDGVCSVVIAQRPCALLVKSAAKPYASDAETCRNCGACMRLGCPAIEKREGYVEVNESLCNGCGLCASVCRFGALEVRA